MLVRKTGAVTVLGLPTSLLVARDLARRHTGGPSPIQTHQYRPFYIEKPALALLLPPSPFLFIIGKESTLVHHDDRATTCPDHYYP